MPPTSHDCRLPRRPAPHDPYRDESPGGSRTRSRGRTPLSRGDRRASRVWPRRPPGSRPGRHNVTAPRCQTEAAARGTAASPRPPIRSSRGGVRRGAGPRLERHTGLHPSPRAWPRAAPAAPGPSVIGLECRGSKSAPRLLSVFFQPGRCDGWSAPHGLWVVPHSSVVGLSTNGVGPLSLASAQLQCSAFPDFSRPFAGSVLQP